MTKPPAEIGGGRVVAYTFLNGTTATGATVHMAANDVTPMPHGLVVCRCENEGGWYLFYCDEQWNVLTDTWHMSEADAKSQAEFEFTGVSALWITPT
jgi:hypothetical protein